MADPLSIAGSVAGIVALADYVFRRVFYYTKAVKGAQKEVQDLATEVRSLAGVLHSLSLLASGMDDDSSDHAFGAHHILECSRTLNEIKARLDKTKTRFEKGRLLSAEAALKWPFTTKQTNDRLAEIARHKETMNLALTADSMQALRKMLSRNDQMIDGLNTISKAVRDLEAPIRINLGAERRQKVVDFFLRVNPQPSLRQSVKLRHPMTGLWLTQSVLFRDWVDNHGSNLWLVGIPGSGKTVLAGATVEQLLAQTDKDDTAVAYFFCTYRNASSITLTNVLGAIATQIAKQKDEAYKMLEQYFDRLHPDKSLDQETDADDLRDIIIDMADIFDRVFIVVDGLDECGDAAGLITKYLFDLAQDSDSISMALFSRNEDEIKDQLQEDFETVPIAAHSGDVNLYVAAELEKRITEKQLRVFDMALKDEILETLIKKADGMFRWVACQLDMLRDCDTDDDCREALKELPRTLSETYERILIRLSQKSKRIQSRVQAGLQLVAYEEPRLTAAQICQAVSTPDDVGAELNDSAIVREDDLFRSCRSLVRMSLDGEYFEYAHFSVREFLESSETRVRPEYKHFSLHKADLRSLLSKKCLRFLQLKNFSRKPSSSAKEETAHIEQRSIEFPLYPYAAVLWPYFVREALEEKLIFNLVTSLFVAKDSNIFDAWLLEFSRHVGYFDQVVPIQDLELGKSPGLDLSVIERVQEFVSASLTPLCVAAALDLSEICLILLERREDVDDHRGEKYTPMKAAIQARDLFYVSGLSEYPDNWMSDETFTPLFSFAGKSREKTIGVLKRSGAGKLYHDPSLLGSALSHSFHSLDFTTLTECLSRGYLFSGSNSEWFDDLIQEFIRMATSDSSDRTRMSANLLCLINTLKNNKIYSTDHGVEACKLAWEAAVFLGFGFTYDPTVVDTTISLSGSSIFMKARHAVRVDDPLALTRLLADKRFDPSYLDETGRSLAHHAVEAASPKTLEVLIKQGLSISQPDSEGNLPIHLCLRQDQHGVLKLLMEHGASHVAVGSEGRTVWHICADNLELCGITSLISATHGQDISQALSMLSDGYTPARIALRNLAGFHSGDIELEEKEVLSLLQHSEATESFMGELPGYIREATNTKSPTVLGYLLERSMSFETKQRFIVNSLHELDGDTCPENIRLLRSHFSDAIATRLEDRLPVEVYVKNVLSYKFVVNSEILRELVDPQVVTSKDQDGTTVWEFVIALFGDKLNPNRPTSSAYGVTDITTANLITETFIKAGLLEAFESEKNISAFLPMCQMPSRSYLFQWPTSHIAELVIEKSQFWAQACCLQEVTALLASAVEHLCAELVEILLAQGVDVHQRSGDFSAIELGSRLNFSDRTNRCKRIFALLTRHSTPSRVNDINPVDKLGLLHRLGKHEASNPTAACWAAEQLLSCGVDIDLRCHTVLHQSALFYCLNGNQTLACLFLDHGADPLATRWCNVANQAAWFGSSRILEKQLSVTRETQRQFDWQQRSNGWYTLNEKTIWFYECSGLHTSILCGSADCTRFYLENHLCDVEATCYSSQLGKSRLSPMHLASIIPQKNVIKTLVDKGFEIAVENSASQQPLHLAVLQENYVIVQLLLEMNADANAPDKDGDTPLSIASTRGYVGIIETMKQFGYSTSQQTIDSNDLPVSRQRLLFLAKELQKSIKIGDLTGCREIIASGCPVNAAMPLCHGCSPLLYAIHLGQAEIAEWMVKNGASTHRESCPYLRRRLPAVLAAWKFSDMSRVLSLILSANLEIGLDWLGQDCSPITSGACAGNLLAVSTFIGHVRDNAGRYAQLSVLPPGEDILTTLINKQWVDRSFGEKSSSALHMASWFDRRDIMELLIQNGAAVDVYDSEDKTPLMYCKSTPAAQLLVRNGASIDINTRVGWDNMNKASEHNRDGIFDFLVLERRRLENTGSSRLGSIKFPGHCNFRKIRPRMLLYMLGLGCDPSHKDFLGCQATDVALSMFSGSMLVNGDIGIEEIMPIRWDPLTCSFHSYLLEPVAFRLYRRRLSFSALQRLFNSEPDAPLSPLCWAASHGGIYCMESLFYVNARIDYEGCPRGTALMVAAERSDLDAFKFLVRNGASLSYVGKDGPKNAFTIIQHHKALVHWLLVDRFQDQKKISATPHWGEVVTPSSFWAGPTRASILLFGARVRNKESSIDWLSKQDEIRKELRGMVVNICEYYYGQDSKPKEVSPLLALEGPM